MNVIVANRFKDALSNINIDVIKKMDGEFDIDTIVETFSNFYFNRMILDITALKDHFNISVLQKLCTSLDASKIILFLDDDPRINNAFLSQIISMGIYNFTRDLTGISYLMENPNSYKDVAQYHNLAISDRQNLNDSKSFNNGPNNTKHSGGFVQFTEPTSSYGEFGDTVHNTLILGFKDLSDDAGSTTLVYMLKKQLSNRKVLAIEVNNNDFSYFNDSELMSITQEQIVGLRNKFKEFDFVLIDLNKSNLISDGTCDEIIYLLEPSTIKLNTLIRHDRMALEKLSGSKIVLNKSMLTQSDVKEFEQEAKVEIFYNIPPLDDRKDKQLILDSFLDKLGVFKNANASGGTKSGFFNNIFKK